MSLSATFGRAVVKWKNGARNESRGLCEMAGHTSPLLSFVLVLISSLIEWFQLKLLLQTLHADYLGRRGDIIRQLALPLSKVRAVKTSSNRGVNEKTIVYRATEYEHCRAYTCLHNTAVQL